MWLQSQDEPLLLSAPLEEGPHWRAHWTLTNSLTDVALLHGGSQQSSLTWWLLRAELYQLCLCLCHLSASFITLGRCNFNFNPTLFLCFCACIFSHISIWLSNNLVIGTILIWVQGSSRSVLEHLGPSVYSPFFIFLIIIIIIDKVPFIQIST